MRGAVAVLLGLSTLVSAESVEVFQMLFQQQRDLVERSLREEVEAMAAKYDQSVAKLEGPIREMGDLDLLLALQNARVSFREGLPTAQGEPLSGYAPFQRLQETWLRLYDQWSLRRAVRITELVAQYDRMLESQQVNATRSDQIEFALEIRAERERLQADEELAALRALAEKAESEPPSVTPVGPQVPILASLQAQTVLFYTFDRDERERVTDRSPARNHGKMEEATWVRQGKRGGGMQFDKDQSRILIENNEHLQITGDLTLSFWMYPEELGLRRNPINKSYGGEYTMTLEPDGVINFYHGIAGKNEHPYQGFGTSEKVKQDTWTHVCLVRSVEEKKLIWYMNGTKVQETDSTYDEAKASQSPVTLGKGYVGSFRGILDDVLILKTDLSESQVRRLYQSLGGR